MTNLRQPDRVIVVGAGHIGIACAHYLRKDGYEVTVIDKGEIGGACSEANCGFLVPSHVLPLTSPESLLKGLKSLVQPRAAFRVKLQPRPALYRWMLEFGRRCNQHQMVEAGKVLHAILDLSIAEYRDLLSGPELECEWQDNGLLFVFRAASALQEFADTDAFIAEKFDVAARLIPGTELLDFDPALREGLAGAYLYEDDGCVRPDKLNTSWVKWLSSQDVRFIDHCQLETVRKENGEISSLLTSQGQMTADRYVFATGAWSSSLAADLDCDIPVEPGKGYSVTMSKPATMPGYPMLFPEAHIGVTPFADSYRIASMMEFVGFDESIPSFRIEQLQDSARPFLKNPIGPAIEDTWYGWRPMTWDSLPIIGRVPRLSNALLATGHNMLGLTLAPVTGKAIADLVAERPADIPLDALSPERFS
jgi:D-amino-acid dehydrogenase